MIVRRVLKLNLLLAILILCKLLSAATAAGSAPETHQQSLTLTAAQSPSAHQLQEVDRLCNSQTMEVDEQTGQSVCIVRAKQIRLTRDTYYPTDNSIVLDAAKLKCLSTNYTPCTLHIVLKSAGAFFELRNGSLMQGKQIIVEAPTGELRILDGSQISASGQSMGTKGTQKKAGYGASFIAQGGGHCTDGKSNSTTYGAFDMQPDLSELSKIGSQVGSCGKRDDVETAGGGRILIKTDSLMIEGAGEKLSANGRPYVDFKRKSYSLEGGSGGYIYVETTNERANNSLTAENGFISAQGGLGVGQHAGGSGGVVVFGGQFNAFSHDVRVNGGQADEFDSSLDSTDPGCKNGGSGTIYHVVNDTLILDNQGLNSTAFTIVSIPSSKPLIGDKQELAKVLQMQGNSRLLIEGQHADLTFDKLNLYEHAWVELSQSKERIHLHIRNESYFGSTTTVDFSQTLWVGIYPGENNTETTFGNILYREFVGIQGINVNLVGQVKLAPTVQDSYKPASKVVIEAANATLFSGAEVSGAYTLVHANQTIQMMEGAKLASYKDHTCTMDVNVTDLFNCVPRGSRNITSLSQTFILDQYNLQFPHQENLRSFTQVLTGLMHNYTNYLIAGDSVSLFGASVEGPRIGICAANVTMQEANVDSTGKGCPGDHGLGRGRQYGQCAGSGGSYGGQGGYGGIENDNESSQEMHECKNHYSDPFSFAKGDFEGSGGASGDYNTTSGGSGGGIIRLSALDTLSLQRSKVHANGSPGEHFSLAPGSGGGAGGSIAITTKNIQGDTSFEARGGDGSEGGGGGGSGGRLSIHFLEGYKGDREPHQSSMWAGSHSVEGGSKGIFADYLDEVSYLGASRGQQGKVRTDKCHGGYSGPFCKPCDAGTFKYDYSYAICKPCDNKPINAVYTGLATHTATCPYECAEGLDPQDINPLCLNALEIQTSRAGGVLSTLAFFAVLLALALVLWIALIVHSKVKSRGLSSLNKKVYDGVLFKTDIDLSPEENLVKPGDLAMRDEDIWSHTHRMYLMGDNSIRFPWYMPKDFPNRALDPADQDKLLSLIDQKQSVVEWSPLEKDFYFLVCVLCPPLADSVHRAFRKRHFNALQREVYRNFNSDFWDMNGRQGQTLRVSASRDDYQLAYIDFLDYELVRSDYIGPQLPMTVLLAGRGTFNSPYRVDFEDDALAKSIVYFHKMSLQEQLPLFFENLNTLLAKLSFYKFTRQAMRDLAQVIDWVELGNKTLFNPLDTKATLFVFENTYCETADKRLFDQKRRSFPLESLVFESFPDVFKALIEFYQSKLVQGESELRLGLVFTPFDPEKKQKLLERIRQIMASNKSRDFESIKRREVKSLIFGEAQVENESPLIGGRLAGTDELQESSVFIHGSDVAKQVKIVDKAKRAYEMSNESTQALELSLYKPRNSCKHKLQAFKGFFVALWILLFKHHGLPPKKGSRYPYFFGYAASVTLDVLLTTVVCIHIFSPIENFKTVGIPFLLLLPAVTLLGPISGVIATLTGSVTWLKLQSSCNSCAVLVNYPLSITVMLITGQDPLYVAVTILLCFNKVACSYFGAKVRQHWVNPGFSKNYDKIKARFRSLVQAQSEAKAGIKSGMTPEERAASLVNSNLPSSLRDGHGGYKLPRVQSLVESDEEEEEEDETSFGIVPKSHLMEKSRESMTQF